MRRRKPRGAIRAGLVLSIFGPGLLCGCVMAPVPGGGGQVTLKEVRSWAYQIQEIEADGAVDALAASRYDLLVLDPTRTDRDNAEFNAAAMVQRLHASPASVEGRTKLVVAYIDIGEAEDWRDYWTEDWGPPTETTRGVPDSMVHPDPDGWAGNYPVAYWDQRWKNIIIYNSDSMLQQALDDDFDGIYMDWVEAYSDEAIVDAARQGNVDPVETRTARVRVRYGLRPRRRIEMSWSYRPSLAKASSSDWV